MVDQTVKGDIIQGLREYVAGDHPLYGHQVDAVHDTADYLDRPLSDEPKGKGKKFDGGSIKMAASAGKTWVKLATAIASGQRVLIISPRIKLNSQIAETYTDAKKLGMSAEDIVVYDSKRSPEEKARAKDAKILVTTDAGFRALHRKGIISGDPQQSGYRPLVLLDESDTLIGPVTGKLLKEYYVPNCVTLGFSATDNGVSETLFDGQPRIHELTCHDAVKRGVEGMVQGIHTLAIEAQPQGFNVADYLGPPGEDYSEELLDKYARDEAVIKAAINFHKTYVDKDEPERGKIGLGKISEYPTLITTPRIETAKYIAGKFNEKFGDDYAMAVSGETPQDDTKDPVTGEVIPGLDSLLDRFNRGQEERPRIIIFPKVIDRGVNIKNATVMISLRPHKDPDPVEQYLGRVTREGEEGYAEQYGHDKIGLGVNIYPPEMKPVLFSQIIKGPMLYSAKRPPRKLPLEPGNEPPPYRPSPQGGDRPGLAAGVNVISDIGKLEILYRDAELARMERERIVPPGWETIEQAAERMGVEKTVIEARMRMIRPGENYTIWGLKAGNPSIDPKLTNDYPAESLIMNRRGQRLLNTGMVDQWVDRQQQLERRHGKGFGTASDIAREHKVSLSTVRSTAAYTIPRHNIRAIEQLEAVAPKKSRKSRE